MQMNEKSIRIWNAFLRMSHFARKIGLPEMPELDMSKPGAAEVMSWEEIRRGDHSVLLDEVGAVLTIGKKGIRANSRRGWGRRFSKNHRKVAEGLYLRQDGFGVIVRSQRRGVLILQIWPRDEQK